MTWNTNHSTKCTSTVTDRSKKRFIRGTDVAANFLLPKHLNTLSSMLARVWGLRRKALSLVVASMTMPTVADVLVSNLNQAGTNALSLSTYDLAQRFTTGGNGSGYSVTSVDLRLETTTSPVAPSVKIVSGSANGTEIATLIAPASLDASTTKIYTYTVSGTVTLDNDTDYWVVAENATNTKWSYEGLGDEDATSQSDWSINDNLESRDSTSNGSFASSTRAVFHLRINGIPNGLILSPTSLVMDEGDSAKYFIKLYEQPSENVSVRVRSDSPYAASVSPVSLTFTSSNWNIAQFVTVTGLHDLDEDDEMLAITHMAAGQRVRRVEVTVIDDDAAPIVESAKVDGTSLIIFFDRNLAAAANLANDAFSVTRKPQKASQTSVTLSDAPMISGSTVTLNLPSTPDSTDTLTVTYTKPTNGTDNILKDSDGDEVESFTKTITNFFTRVSGLPVQYVEVVEGETKSFQWSPPGTPTQQSPVTLAIRHWSIEHVTVVKGSATAKTSEPVSFQIYGREDDDWSDEVEDLWVAMKVGENYRRVGYVAVNVFDDDAVEPGETNGCADVTGFEDPFWRACMEIGITHSGNGFEAPNRSDTMAGIGALSKTTVNRVISHEIDAIIDFGTDPGSPGFAVSFASDTRHYPSSWVISFDRTSFLSFSDATYFWQPRKGALRPSSVYTYSWGHVTSFNWRTGSKVTVELIDVPPPTGVKAAPGDQQATLTWTAPTGITVSGYEVRVCKGPRTAYYCAEYASHGAPPRYDRQTTTGGTATSWTVTQYHGEELQNDVTYTVQVRANSLSLKGGWSDPVEFVPTANLQVLEPPAPRITNVISGGLNATYFWEMPETVEGITGWQLRYGDFDLTTLAVEWGEWSDLEGATADTRSHTLSGLAEGSDYGIELRVLVGRLAGAPSPTNYISGVLHSVSGFTATPLDGSVQLSWPVPSYANEIGNWEVRWKTADASAFADWTDIVDSSATTTTHAVAELVNQTKYAFQIRAIATNNQLLAESEIVEAFAGSAPPPAAPRLRIEAGVEQATLIWLVPESVDPITGWQLRYGATSGEDSEPAWNAWTDIEDATGETLEHTVTGLTNGTEYAFELRAIAGDLIGASSETRLGTPDEDPIADFDTIYGMNITSTTVDLVWTLIEGSAPTSLTIEQRLVEQEWQTLATLDGDATSYIVTGLEPSTRYQFRVVAETARQRAASGLVQIDTLAKDPLHVQMTGTSPGSSCPVQVSVTFLNDIGDTVAVDALSASDFTLTNGHLDAPTVAEDGLSWSASASATTDFSGLMRVRLRANEDWRADEQVFSINGTGKCDVVPRTALAELQLEGAALEPTFAHDTFSYQVAAPPQAVKRTLRAVAAYDDAEVTISSPADADNATPGHQVLLANDLAVVIDVSNDGSASRYVINGYAAEIEELTGFTLVDASTDADLSSITEGSTLEVSSRSTYGIRAEVADGAVVGSVTLSLTGPTAQDTHTQTENVAPYSLYGDNAGAEYGRALAAGSYTLSATAYPNKNGAGDSLSALSIAFTVTDDTQSISPSLFRPLSATGLSISGATLDSLELAWTLPDQPQGVTVAGVEVQRESAGSWHEVTTLPTDATTYTVSGLTSDTSYQFRIRIVTNAGDAYSEPVRASTLAEPLLTGFTLLDVSNQSVVATLSDGVDVDLGARFGDNFGVRAEVTSASDIGSVTFSLSGAKTVAHTENIAPYSLYGDANTGPNSALNGESLPVGAYTLSATVYDASGASGNVLDSLSVSFQVLARVALSVQDARAEEGTDASIPFIVTLSRTAQETVNVQYATSDDTATAGVDYTAASGTLSFATGDTSKTLEVTIANDDHDEGAETFTLTLSQPSGAGSYLADATATGTIENSDPLPKAWLARFGRATSDNVVEAISRRLEHTSTQPPESHFTVRGQRIQSVFGRFGRSSASSLDSMALEHAPSPREIGRGNKLTGVHDVFLPEVQLPSSGSLSGTAFDVSGSREHSAIDRTDHALTHADAFGTNNNLHGQLGTIAAGADDTRWTQLYREGVALSNGGQGFNLRDLLLNSSFYYSPGKPESPSTSRWRDDWALWGESGATRFSGAEGELGIDGEVTSTIVGFDRPLGGSLAGLALAYTEGSGAFTNSKTGTSTMRGSLTNLHPYVQWQVNERTSTWGILGYGEGALELTPHNASPIATAMSYSMAAMGGRTALALVRAESGTYEFAIKSDARTTKTTSGTVSGLMGATGEVSRVRLMVESNGSLPWVGGVLTPTLDTGIRYDGGDAETGVGLELSGGVGYAFGAMRVVLNARVLAAHQDRAYKEWGTGASFVYEPSNNGRGLSLSLNSNRGVDPQGGGSLWSQPNASELIQGESLLHATQRFKGQLGYGLETHNSRVLWVPYIGIDEADDAHVGLQLASGSNLTVDIEIARGFLAMPLAFDVYDIERNESAYSSEKTRAERLPTEDNLERSIPASRDDASGHALRVNWELRW
ncbi:MAG: fibronectin type III domain-containing protein [Gammaproteobacteria bacterium]|nr:fibronectin type III domain-containing protein [Gammaproteobacteria bacterium]